MKNLKVFIFTIFILFSCNESNLNKISHLNKTLISKRISYIKSYYIDKEFRIFDVTNYKDSLFFVFGRTNNFDRKIICLNKKLDTLWTVLNTDNNEPNKIFICKDKYLYAFSFSDNCCKHTYFYIDKMEKFDFNGNQIFEKELLDGSDCPMLKTQIIKDNYDNFIITSNESYKNTSKNIPVIKKYNRNGNQIWKKTFENEVDDFVNNSISIVDNHFFVNSFKYWELDSFNSYIKEYDNKANFISSQFIKGFHIKSIIYENKNKYLILENKIKKNYDGDMFFCKTTDFKNFDTLTKLQSPFTFWNFIDFDIFTDSIGFKLVHKINYNFSIIELLNKDSLIETKVLPNVKLIKINDNKYLVTFSDSNIYFFYTNADLIPFPKYKHDINKL